MIPDKFVAGHTIFWTLISVIFWAIWIMLTAHANHSATAFVVKLILWYIAAFSTMAVYRSETLANQKENRK